MKREGFASGEERSKPSEFKEDKIEIVIEKDERYPDFLFVTKEDVLPHDFNEDLKKITITREQAEWLRKVEEEYNKGQAFLAQLSNWEE